LCFVVSGVSVSAVFVFPQPVSEGVGVRVVASRGWCVDPVFSPDGGFVAYSSNASGGFDVWLVDVGGRGCVRVTCLEGDERGPQFSPDGRWIAFVHEYEGVVNLFVFDRAGLGVVRLTEDGAPKGRFEWSPRGGLLVYDVFQGGGWGVWVADVAGGFRWRVCGGECFDPSWSGDGRFVVCVGRKAENYTLQIIDLETQETKQLYSASYVIRQPRFSSNNTRIIFLQNSSNSWSIYGFNLLTGEVRNLLEAPPGGLITPPWKPAITDECVIRPRPNSGEILFSGYSAKGVADLFLIMENAPIIVSAGAFDIQFWGTRVERLTQGYDRIMGVVWSGDGSKFAYAAIDDQMLSKIVLQQYVEVKVVSIYGR
jgi:Tol biopolymer transport system component